ncbi:MAG TPA: YggS family pyridoxal phosphate-dependent enzyme [Bacteroidia bacterium]
MFQKEVYTQILNEIPSHVQLVAVSKTYGIDVIQNAYDEGVRVFGENKVQELVPKAEALPKDIRWHLIGHLQTNKVKYIAPFVEMIHSVDSFKLLQEIQKQALKNNRTIKVLLQFHISYEETKFGFNPENLDMLLKEEIWNQIPNVQICGVMGMASFSEDMNQVRNEFKSLKNIFDTLKKSQLFSDSFKEISMGMSGDYKIAVEEGSTMIRVGSALFGKRNYA